MGYNKIYETGESSPFTRPYTQNLWLSIAAWIFVSTIILIFINYTVYRVKKPPGGFELLDACFTPFEAFTNQSKLS